MIREEKEFRFRFSLEGVFPEDYDGEEDNHVWLREWESRIKPDLLKVIFDTLRKYPIWSAHVRNRGLSPMDEIEIAMVRDVARETIELPRQP